MATEFQIGRAFMSANLLMALVSFAVCVVLTPVVRAVAMGNGWYDMPGELKIHSTPTPRVGGVALMAGILMSSLFSLVSSRTEFAILLILVGVWAVRLLDDIRSTSPLLRLTADLGCGAALWLLGWKLQWFSSSALDIAATAIFVAFAINSMNLLDGIDGLTLTVSSIAGIGFIVLLSGRPLSFASGLAWTLAAGCVAMLVYNLPPAKIFIGDCGSTLLGAALAFLALDWVRSQPTSHSTLFPLVFLGLPFADAFAAVVRRLRGRRSPLSGDRRHFYDLLLSRGLSVRQILVLSATTTSVLVVVSLTAARHAIDYRFLLFGGLVLYGFFGFYLGSFDPESPVEGRRAPPPRLDQRRNEELGPQAKIGTVDPHLLEPGEEYGKSKHAFTNS